METMPIELVVMIITWLAFWGAAAAILFAYHRSALRKASQAPDEHRMADTSPMKYIVIAVFVGGLVLPFYFYAVSHKARGLLIGLGWLVVAVVFASGLRFAAVSVLAQAPSVEITAPSDGATLQSGIELFYASVRDLQDGKLAPQNIVWTSDKTGELGRGPSLMGGLPKGQHVVTVTATDSDGNAASDSITVTSAIAE